MAKDFVQTNTLVESDEINEETTKLEVGVEPTPEADPLVVSEPQATPPETEHDRLDVIEREAEPATPELNEEANEEPAEDVEDDTEVETPAFTVGDKAYYKRDGVLLPVVVQVVTTGGTPYTVVGDISGSDFPAGLPYGPFTGVSADSLSSR